MSVDIVQLLAMYGMLNPKQTTQAGKTLNVQQDVMNNMLFSPLWGASTDTYDPMLTLPEPQYVPAPQVGMPTAMSYSNGTGTMADISNGLISNSLTFDGALRMLKEALASPSSDINGMDEKTLTDEVRAIRDEVTKYAAQQAEAEFKMQNAPRTDIFAKAGLPSPTEQYTADTLPSTSAAMQALMSRLTPLQAEADKAQAALDSYRSESKSKRASQPPAPTVERTGDPKLDAHKVEVEKKLADVEAQFRAAEEQYKKTRSVLDAGKLSALWQRRANLIYERKHPGWAGYVAAKPLESQPAPFPKPSEVDQTLKDLMAKQETAGKKSKRVADALQAAKEGQLAALNYLGRTPLQDALQQRAAAMKAIGM